MTFKDMESREKFKDVESNKKINYAKIVSLHLTFVNIYLLQRLKCSFLLVNIEEKKIRGANESD